LQRGNSQTNSYYGFDWDPQQPCSNLKNLIMQKGVNFLRESVLTKKVLESLNAQKLKEMTQMMDELYVPAKLTSTDLEQYIKEVSVLPSIFSTVKDLNYPAHWFQPLCNEVRNARSHFDKQALESEKRGLVMFLYEFARSQKDVAFYRKIQKAIEGLDYLEKELISRGPSGIKITLHCGTNLASKDSNGFSDPYVKFDVAGKQYKTKIIWKNLDPSWDESFEITEKGVSYNNLHIVFTVMDKDVVGSDDYMGETESINCSAPWVGEVFPKTSFELNNSSKPKSHVSGSIFISVEGLK